MIAKGRSLEQALIEDSLEIFRKILLEIPQHWREEELSIEKEFREKAKMESDGDKEFERISFILCVKVLTNMNIFTHVFMNHLFFLYIAFMNECLKKL